MKNKEGLKPCPFCGNEDIFLGMDSNFATYYSVGCLTWIPNTKKDDPGGNHCCYFRRCFSSKAEAKRVWNRRAK